MNPAEWLTRTATRTPDLPAIFKGREQVATYGQFREHAAAIGAALSARGICKGDRVALFSPNCTEYLPILYGIWFAGATAVPINGKLHPAEVAWIVEDCSASLVFCADKELADLSSRLSTTTLGISTAFPELTATPPLPAPHIMDRDDILWLFYTSGTTGRPKGVMITCGNLEAMTLSYFADVDEVKTEDAILYAAPMSHGAGLYNFMHVIRGARHIVPESGGFDPAEVLDLAPERGPLSMFAAPTMVRRLVDHAKASGQTGGGIKTIVYAGGPMYLADIIEAVEIMGDRFVQIYGQGECPMAITVLPRADVSDRTHPDWQARLASVGFGQSVSQVAILDETGGQLPPGETGEIAVRGSAVMAGYWQNPTATAKTIREGWLWTGDMGHMDEDGYVTLVDRSKDMIISGGSNVYPREVEEVLLTHPNVQECAVVGRPHADWGEEVVAFIVPKGDCSETELNQLCLEAIARFKRPKDYVFVSDLPKNNYGKVLKTVLRDRLSDT